MGCRIVVESPVKICAWIRCRTCNDSRDRCREYFKAGSPVTFLPAVYSEIFLFVALINKNNRRVADYLLKKELPDGGIFHNPPV